jgi:hypothetical protein
MFYVTIVRTSVFIVDLRRMLRQCGQEGDGNVFVCEMKWVYLTALERRYYFFSLLVCVKSQVHQSRWKTAERQENNCQLLILNSKFCYESKLI